MNENTVSPGCAYGGSIKLNSILVVPGLITVESDVLLNDTTLYEVPKYDSKLIVLTCVPAGNLASVANVPDVTPAVARLALLNQITEVELHPEEIVYPLKYSTYLQRNVSVQTSEDRLAFQ